jgi:branched-chain amino acid transport system permease protein
VVSAFSAWGLIAVAGLPFWLALLLVVLGVSALSYLLDAFVIRRIAGQPQFAGVMLTIALAFMMRGIVSMVAGPEARNYSTPFTGQHSTVAGIAIGHLQLVILGITLAVTVTFFLFFRHTRLGVAMQAASQNQLAAYYMGIPVKRLNGIAWGLAAAVAAIAGLLLAPITFVHANMGFIGLKAFPAAVVGGFGSLPGAIVGGLIIGLVESLSGFYLPDGFKDTAAYIVVLIMLVVKPTGLFGEKLRKKV